MKQRLTGHRLRRAIEQRASSIGPRPKLFIPDWLEPHIPQTVPGWLTTDWFADGAKWALPATGQTAILTGGVEADGKRWLHFSTALPTRVPSWDDVVRAKEAILGPERLAVSVYVPRSQWISVDDFCLHLWSCLDGDPVPNFARDGLI